MIAPPASEEFIGRVPHCYAREFLVLCVRDEDGSVVIEHAESTPGYIVHNVRVRIGERLASRVVDAETLAGSIDAAYHARNGEGLLDAGDDGAGDDALEVSQAGRDADLLAVGGKSEAARVLDRALFDAIDRGASDVHIHPCAEETLVRFRADGVLTDVFRLPRGMTASVISRLKVLGGMDTAESRKPQDGRATVTLGRRGMGGRGVDLRMSTIPTECGERAVIRLLDTDRGRRLADLDSIGMPGDVRGLYERVITRPNGLVLLTGPTGSGKTTTLYATLRRVASRPGSGGVRDGMLGGAALNIMTVEDPVEYRLSGGGVTVSQSQVNRKKGMTFASGLRHILRQDPDVVMVGEIRDAETARLAIQAALTGHLVFSTLHTNDAVGAPPRLIDLGAEAYLVSSSLTAVLAQRLVRVLHGACRGSGCEGCLGSGFSGRTGIFEWFALDETVREMVSGSASASALRVHAAGAGMRSLREDGMRLVSSGVTTRGEIERVTVDLSELAGTDALPGLADQPAGVSGGLSVGFSAGGAL